ncbi:EboA domain-containing protein [Streptomyces daliensis]
MLTPLASLRTGLELRLGHAAREWLHRALADAADAGAPHRPSPPPTSPTGANGRAPLPPWERHFAEAGRKCATPTAPHPAHTSTSTSASASAPGPAEAARILLLHAAGAEAPTVTRLYEHGSAEERRAVLRALPHLPFAARPDALPLVEDALRANDTSLVAAAVGPYGAAHLDPHAWRHAVLKCLFTGVPLEAVAGLETRARGDAELARMLVDYAREREAAGRSVPAGLHRVLDLANTPPPPQSPPHPQPQPQSQPEES